jgi:long-chain-fatty-acid--[acyl-carrier-protein] ligase
MLNFILFAFRTLLSLRYRTEFVNFDIFDAKNPVIVFPNHPALVDPLIVVSNIAKKKLLSPVMTETYFHIPGLGGIIRAMGTVPVGDIARGGNAEDVRKAFVGIREAMKNRQNITLYPSGHIYVQPFEHIVGKKMAYEIVGMLDADTRGVLLRTKGLWGSMWGKAYTGKSPEMIKTLAKSVWIILANLVFFVPKRDVRIECVDMTERLKAWHAEGLDAFNRNLEDFYNEGGEEPCRFVRHYAYHDDVAGKTEPRNIPGSVAEIGKGSGIGAEDIPPEIFEAVRELVAGVKKIEAKTLKFDTNLILDLHADSLDMAEMKSAVQSMFPGASNPPIGLIKTIGDLSATAIGRLEGEEKLPPVDFLPASDATIDFRYEPGDTIPSLMKRNFRKYRKDAFVYDAMTGAMIRDGFILKSYVVAECLRKYPGEKIGIMIPALSATSLLLVGAYLAGKLPVMLNWTVGEASFAHCMNFAGLDTILTSRKFYEKITSPWLAKFEGKMVFIEDIVKDIPLPTKLIAVARKSLFLLPKARKEAVMLFTSGSESLPKAVVLSHENVLSDIAGALALVPFRERETLLGFLPPFHSFGFTLNTIFPLVAPVQVAYTPDPSDSRTIGKILAHTGATIVSATPTFLRMILAGNSAGQLRSLRYAFVGAEKCGDDVFAQFREKCSSASVLEGYGITECSPIVTVNPIDRQKK